MTHIIETNLKLIIDCYFDINFYETLSVKVIELANNLLKTCIH